MPWPTIDDDEVFALIDREVERQNTTIQLIASENFTSPNVLRATGSVLTNKYSEGYPGKRYYGGNEVIDEVEELARERCKALFRAPHANVQPHAGANANMGVYLALLEPGDTVLGLRLDQGGHLTHGSPVNASGKLYRFASYGVTMSDERIDLDQVRDLALEHRPKIIVAGATAYPRLIDPAPFREIADECGAVFMFDAAHVAGLIAGGQHPNPMEHGADIMTFTTHKTLRGPRGGAIVCTEELADRIDKAIFPGLQGGPLDHVIAAKAVAFAEARRPEFADYAHQIVTNARALAEGLVKRDIALASGGTDNHLVLLDVFSSVGLTGRQAENVLLDGGVVTNRNSIPNDPNGAWYASGIRVGTPALTTLGMGTPEMDEVADIMATLLKAATPTTTKSGEPSKAKYEIDDSVTAESRQRCADLLSRFRLYPEVDL